MWVELIAVAVAFITIPNFPMAALIAAAPYQPVGMEFFLYLQKIKEGLIVSVLGLIVALVIGLFWLSHL